MCDLKLNHYHPRQAGGTHSTPTSLGVRRPWRWRRPRATLPLAPPACCPRACWPWAGRLEVRRRTREGRDGLVEIEGPRRPVAQLDEGRGGAVSPGAGAAGGQFARAGALQEPGGSRRLVVWNNCG
ncbi:hypothetical protein PAHAL_6G187800 [Panicum hallii]|uniref:Uncharacterized protein n=1 Tax=Panicum hallii TaxID=206008 RepID=A0A2T8IGU8_9POAL|nr:hypothetical protein PAHAL_6G187800 [Panicum hallii]